MAGIVEKNRTKAVKMTTTTEPVTENGNAEKRPRTSILDCLVDEPVVVESVPTVPRGRKASVVTNPAVQRFIDAAIANPGKAVMVAYTPNEGTGRNAFEAVDHMFVSYSFDESKGAYAMYLSYQPERERVKRPRKAKDESTTPAE